MRSLLFLASLTVGLCFLAGCGETVKVAPKVKVKGEVFLDNKPMPSGEIVFVEQGKVPEILPVTNGSFNGEVTIGKKVVQINSYREEKAPPTATDNATTSKVNVLPARFNAASTLAAEIEQNKTNEFKYSVASK
jgi:hypothetical protein